MQFRVISDLHVDINSKYYSKFKFDPKAYYLIAGDIAGSRFKVAKFLNHYKDMGKLNKCIFVEGNHLGYDVEWKAVDQTKDACYAYLHEQFPIQNNITFLNNGFKEIGDDIIVVGCTLYTDYNLYDNRELAMMAGEYYLNDFKFVRTYSNLGDDRRVNALDYEKWFKESIQFIAGMCKANPRHKIVVLTHHAPSIQSMAEKYKNDIISASYTSNLEEFILSHPNIKLWVHGHAHNLSNYTIGNCQVVANPFGYYNENGMKLTRYIGEVYEI